MCERQIERARALVHEQVASGRSPSCQALVVRHGQTVLAETAGVQTPDGPPLTFDHAFPLASAGQPWLAALILQLAEEGAIGLHDRVDSIVPEINADGRNDDVLVRHLLTHTQGWEFGSTSETALRLMRGEYADPDAFDDAGREMMFRVAQING